MSLYQLLYNQINQSNLDLVINLFLTLKIDIFNLI